LLADGSVRCCGSNYYWQLGDEGPDRATSVEIALPARALEIAVGDSSTCATLSDGSTRCWGNNAFGKLGQGTFGGRSATPLPIAGFYGATAPASGIYHHCAIRNGEPWCWGNNDEGESGGVLQGRPVQVLTDVDDVEVGFGGSCARRSDDTAWCWGSFGYGDQYGTWHRTPARIASWTDVVDVAVGNGHACVVRDGGALWCWGTNYHGELGDGTTTTRDYLAPSTVTSVVSVDAGGAQTCAIRTGGELWCWGYAGSDFGTGTAPHAMLADVIDVRLSWHNGCAIDTAHRLWCWGENDNREVPGGLGTWVATPVAVMTDVASVMPGIDRLCAIRLDGTQWCWGQGYVGGPTLIGSVGIGAVGAAGLGFDCIARNGDAVWCRGSNLWAQIGDGTLIRRTEPVDIGLGGIVDLSAEWQHTCAVNAAGALWCWGGNHGGQIGAGGQARMVAYPAKIAL
jgi:alpha-tubulin suppressor-like RCC1 family protein